MKTVSVTLREDLKHIDHDALEQELTAEAGIHAIHFDSSRNHTLTIDYDPAVLSETQLLNSIYRHGVYPEPAPQDKPD
jgi:hypothetical protein